MKYKSSGFTIVELLIVVVVIAILAAITIVSFNNITSRAKESSLKSDLNNSAKIVELKKVTDGAYPANNAAAALTASTGNTLTYSITQAGYCIEAKNGSQVFKTTHAGTMYPDDCYERVFTTKGALAGSCSPSACYTAVLNTTSFTPGSYKARCLMNGSPVTSYQTYTITATGSKPLSCYVSSSGNPSVSIEIEGWGVSEPATW